MYDLKKGEICVVNEGKALLIDLVGLAESNDMVDKLECVFEILKAIRDGRNALKSSC